MFRFNVKILTKKVIQNMTKSITDVYVKNGGAGKNAPICEKRTENAPIKIAVTNGL